MSRALALGPPSGGELTAHRRPDGTWAKPSGPTGLVEGSSAGGWTTGVWPTAVTQAGFHRKADVGGIQMLKRTTSS